MSKDTADNELPEGFFSHPEKIVVSDEAFDRITEICESDEAPSPALLALMSRQTRWVEKKA